MVQGSDPEELLQNTKLGKKQVLNSCGKQRERCGGSRHILSSRHSVLLHLLPCGKRHFPGSSSQPQLASITPRQHRSARAPGQTKDREGRAINHRQDRSAQRGDPQRQREPLGAVSVSCPLPGMEPRSPGCAAVLRLRWSRAYHLCLQRHTCTHIRVRTCIYREIAA